MKLSRYLTAKEVAEALDVSIATVYAYVSRGLIRSEPGGKDSRTRLYSAEDVQRLRDQKVYRHDPAQAANNAMHWGMPVLESALTHITESGLYYRGHDVIRLVREHSVEQVAALLWTGDMANEQAIFATTQPVQKYLDSLQILDTDYPELAPLQKLHIALALASTDDLAAYDLDTNFDNIVQTGGRILKLMSAVLTGIINSDMPVARILQQGWRPQEMASIPLLNAALILCADHELNASSFTARVVASAAAQLYLVVMAGLAALQGFKHGGNTVLVEGLLCEAGTARSARKVIAERLRRGERIPGFGHRLYPGGDPRSSLLLDLLRQTYPNASTIQLANALAEAVEEVTGKKPNVDFALVTLAQTLQLPAGSALAIFALGRTIGWVGHAIEQYRSGQIIRPRARYVGP